ncbi:MAG: hypothetical protein ABL961_13325 [Vicinamibacterales bacterium]
MAVKYHKVYRSLVEAVSDGRLEEPFGQAGFRRACPGFADGTYRAFLWKHSGAGGIETGASGETLLLERTSPGKFKLVRPFKDDF